MTHPDMKVKFSVYQYRQTKLHVRLCRLLYLLQFCASSYLYLLCQVQSRVPCRKERRGSEAMGCTSAKQLSSVPSDEEGRGKAYSNGDAFSGQCPSCPAVLPSSCYNNLYDIYGARDRVEFNSKFLTLN